MDHDEYTTAVDEGRWPTDPKVPLPAPFVNENGTIQNLLLKQCKSVTSIISKRGAVRANHYHRTDWHYTYVVSGRVLYFERAVGQTTILPPKEFGAGDMYFTPPNLEHSMLFLEESVVLTFAKNVRTHEEHEADLVRVPDFITPSVAAGYLATKETA